MDSRGAAAAVNKLKRRTAGFTLVEVLVTAVIVSISVVGVLGAISSLTRAQANAQDAVLLQRLANEKLNDIRLLQDPSSTAATGDFSDRAYPDITWTADVESTSTTNLDQVTVTATRDKSSQSITTLMYVIPAVGATAATGNPATSQTVTQ